MTVARKGPDVRPAQGRVGDDTRQAATPLDIHPLLSATAPHRPDRPESPRAATAGADARRGTRGPTAGAVVSPRTARTTVRGPRPGAAPAAHPGLSRPESGGAPAPGLAPSRGKGVHAA